jgi:type VI secretion system protein ImpC
MGVETMLAKPLDLPPLGESILDELLKDAKIDATDETYPIVRSGLAYALADALSRANQGASDGEIRPDNTRIAAAIATLDEAMSSIVDEILHHPDVQKLESAWRGLKFVIDRTNFRENIKFELLHCSKDDLVQDFDDAPELTKSGYYRLIYSAEYGQFGGEPYGAIISTYDLGPNARDMKLLQKVAAVSAMAHAPFIAAAGPSFFGAKSFLELPNLKDLKALFQGPQYAKWQSMRETEDARYVGLVCPRFLLRVPYSPEDTPSKKFAYRENVAADHEHYLWGNCSFAFASRLTESFAKYRWCANIIGPQSGGTVADLPLHHFEAMGETQTKIPTEILITERREFELSEEGFISLNMRKDSDNAAFFSANSIQRPKTFGSTPEGKAAETNYRLGTQLPYVFVITRLAHYIKVQQREHIGSWKERGDLQRELDNWLRQYVVDMESPTPEVRSMKPFRQAAITVKDPDGNPGWYAVEIKVRPHFKYMGAHFELSLVGKLDKD